MRFCSTQHSSRRESRKTLLSYPPANIAEGQIPTYDSKKALFSGGLILEDECNDTVEIWAKDQDFSNMPLYIPNIKNFDVVTSSKTTLAMIMVEQKSNVEERGLSLKSRAWLSFVGIDD